MQKCQALFSKIYKILLPFPEKKCYNEIRYDGRFFAPDGGKNMYTFTSRVRFSETDEDERLSLAGIMNYLQDCSVFHSEDAHDGTQMLHARDRVWLLNSWQIIIKERPKCCEYIEIGTQPYRFKGTLGMRNFCIRKQDQTECVVANSNWVLVQRSTMHPVRVTENDIRPYELGEPFDMPYADRKITAPKEGIVMETITVLAEHLDCNHHVNNTQYVLMASRYLPEGFALHQVRAEYRYQALLGDTMTPVVTKEDDQVIIQLKKDEQTAYAVIAFS